MNTQNTFTFSVNQHPSNLGFISRMRAQAEYMFLSPVVKAGHTIITFTVECDTSHEKSILEKMASAR